MQLLCTALQMKFDVDVGGTKLLFFFCSGQRGLGSITLIIVLHTMNGAYWKIRTFLNQTGENVLLSGQA